MKKASVIAIMLFLILGTSIAQEGNKQKKTPEQKAKKQTEIINNQLNLTGDQQTKIYPLLLSNITQIDAIKAKYGDNRSKERNKELRDLKIKFTEELKTILTADQYDKWNKEREAKVLKAKEDRKNNITPTEPQPENIY
jgi:hypothetical protein